MGRRPKVDARLGLQVFGLPSMVEAHSMTILLIILILLVLGGGFSYGNGAYRNHGMGLGGLLLVILVVMALGGRL